MTKKMFDGRPLRKHCLLLTKSEKITHLSWESKIMKKTIEQTASNLNINCQKTIVFYQASNSTARGKLITIRIGLLRFDGCIVILNLK